MIINLNDGIIKVESEEERETLLNVLRPQGEWINKRISYGELKHTCNKCYNEKEVDSMDNFCPKCGAKMKKEAENE